ncbi:MAG TPA: PilZ domain-containing protein, partial [Tepidisphaeraceae bacterium]
EEPIALADGTNTSVFAEWLGRFFQQGIQIIADNVVAGAAPVATTMIRFTRVGEPVSAESRGSYRVGVAAQQVYALVDEQRCQVVDLSPEGCAVISVKPLTVGGMVDVSLTFEGVEVAGPMKVQTVKILRNGSQRFGLFATDKKSKTRASLQKLSSLMQRMQLKRFAGAA